ncbi:nitroreductase/quinone reductase family protein [Mycobacterium avium]|uniref:nitroreductase/quinone reductase family protein n=1 Tax=Mycobacterium avium TaxID=1764 RepID=UPI0003D1D04D|nr:nitroreductase/quinone reductase family protein [Mycobacterium avium]ETA90114.1 hypothetical protein O984_23930 [Mycobacterium avium 05-4293]MDV3303009.1 nitroreductase family deazaflavin-dependent oxidoreductase [Mycobacterium avium subsp. hominissuis]PBA13781.1 nitroreductase family deazaflavin-dependent oxidoreductase [Mycobacterium avium]PBA89823.1 nitroreductase family deazaflavin-dependent oxidoreductase [Mycobacterium avium]PBJ47003.1 nitroreductase family deazaflavin-dependent oxido
MSDYQNFTREQEQELNRRNIDEFRANHGKVGGPFDGFDLLLLHTVGAKSGADRLNPVGYFDIENKRYIVGSAAGRNANPAWVANVRAHPDIQVELGGKAPTAARAVELEGAERDRIFAVVKERAPGFAGYEAATDRLIPVFEVQITE